MISLTIDTDWAPTPVIEDTLSIFEEFGHTVTVFSTHDDGLDLGEHERALHPNFLGEDQDDEAILADLVDTFPDAVGTRSHSLYTHGQLQSYYPDFGIKYESNYFMYLQDGIAPFWMGEPVVQLPFFFIDDVALKRGELERLSPEDLISGDGMKIFAFHPVHVFLNSPTLEYYQNHKGNYQDVDELRRNRYSGYGIRDFLFELSSFLNERGSPSKPMRLLAQKWTTSADDVASPGS